jgi:hypothetical protein
MMIRNTRAVMWLSFTLMVLASLLVGGSPAHAQTDAVGTCAVEPRSVDELVGLFSSATPVADDASLESVQIPTGGPASAVLTAAITQTVADAYACLNAGDGLRFLAMLTDDAVVASFPWVGEALLSGEVPAEFTAPSPLPESARQTVIAVADVRNTGPNQAAALVVYTDPSLDVAGPTSLHLEFTRVDDRWLISRVAGFTQ